jgi:hypothetical protein
VDEIRRINGSVPVVSPGGPVKWQPGEMRTVIMSPVASLDPADENSKFWQATPSGKIELGCANLAAAEAFELGTEYYVDFTPAG